MLAVADLGSAELIPVLAFVRHGKQDPLVLANDLHLMMLMKDVAAALRG